MKETYKAWFYIFSGTSIYALGDKFGEWHSRMWIIFPIIAVIHLILWRSCYRSKRSQLLSKDAEKNVKRLADKMDELSELYGKHKQNKGL